MSNEDETHEENLKKLKAHILSCPSVQSKSKATTLVIDQIDKELLRLDRDKKLQKKFSNVASKSSSSVSNDVNVLDDDLVEIPSPPNKYEEDEDMEWQDINNTTQVNSESTNNGMKGKVLSEITIQQMSQHKTLVNSYVSAIGIAVHGILLHLGFICTGIPPNQQSGGFAPAVRDLPKGIYIPKEWNKDKNTIRLRYRKNDLGTRILRIVLNENTISIYFHTTSTREDEYITPLLSFDVAEYINVHSFTSALEKNKTLGIAPALHYKSLSVLINTFCDTFDLGDHPKEQEEKTFYMEQPPYSNNYTDVRSNNTYVNPLEVNPHRTDFESDLRPPCLRVDPLMINPTRAPQPSTGNLMGPNHPMFHQEDDLYGNAPNFGGMQPRFDPYGPPSLLPGRGRGRRGRVPHNIPGGDPNPDHLKAPRDFDPGDMYL